MVPAAQRRTRRAVAVKCPAMPESSLPETFRLFIAISLPENVKDEIEKAQAALRRALPGGSVRWTKREQFHLTLKFLGDLDGARVEELSDSLRRACERFSPLRLRAERIGFFPDRRRPRVVWVGIHDVSEELPKVQAAIESAVKSFTARKPEGRFAGHVTLGRCQEIRKPHVETLTRLASGMKETVFGEWTADKIELVRSEFLPGGMRYTDLAALPLTGRQPTDGNVKG